VSKALIIVESPAKARTISKYLGKDFIVESSIGHVRDLPSKADEIPAAYRKKAWSRTGVDVENGFKPLYIVPTAKKAQVKKLKDLLANASALYLATDEDREGEAIAWHLKEVLKPKVPVMRMVFHEITEKAINEALEHPRELDERLVNAQETRRILDRLYGYEVSPVLWKKVKPRLSAGRVQSVATRLIVQRERARIAFHSADYWSVGAQLDAGPGKNPRDLQSELLDLDGRRLASGKDFDEKTGERSAKAVADKVLVLGKEAALKIEDNLEGKTLRVAEVKKKPFTRRPAAPFITSTLQQEAGRKLRYTAQRAMRVAQRLYENGYITYMRTDSTTLSQEALNAARKQIGELYGADYLPDAPRTYTKKSKGAQEAHEAIRPAGEVFRTPESLKEELDEDALRLYELIWKRTVASQMKDANGQRTSMRFKTTLDAQGDADGSSLASEVTLSSSGQVITFPGFLRAYVEGSDDPEEELGDKERILPDLSEGDEVTLTKAEAKGHTTQPPSRYSEAALVKELEERGIGRPSTYASIIQTIQDRGYVWKKSGALVPTLTAFAVTNLLELHFGELVDYEFTANMENTLDDISSGEREAVPYLEKFFFGENKRAANDDTPRRGPLAEIGLKDKIEGGVEDIDARAVCSLTIGQDEQTGVEIAARVGRYGPYLQVGDSDRRANLPLEIEPDALDVEEARRLIRQSDIANRPLGEHPETGQPVYLKTGRYGPYVQLGDPELTPKGNIKKGSKPKMSSLFPSMDIETLNLDDAVFLLSFPKVLGQHPDTGADITAQDGQYGPYLLTEHEGKKDSRSLTDHEQLVKITLDEAVALFRQPKQRGRNARNQGPIAELGQSPVTGAQILVKDGRFGPYVTDGEVNATIPSTRDPKKVSFDDALELIANREERMRSQGKEPRPKKGAKKAASTKKKAAKKKAAPKKKAGAKKKKAAPKKKSATKKKATTKKKKAAAKKKS
jgi:DNA topoisomerase-1